jgi:hypothetical protein
MDFIVIQYSVTKSGLPNIKSISFSRQYSQGQLNMRKYVLHIPVPIVL